MSLCTSKYTYMWVSEMSRREDLMDLELLGIVSQPGWVLEPNSSLLNEQKALLFEEWSL